MSDADPTPTTDDAPTAADDADGAPTSIDSVEDLKQRSQRLQNSTKTYVFEFPDGATVEFEYRMLSEDEIDQVRDENTRQYRDRTGDVETEVDTKGYNVGLIKRGVESGPEGWTATDHEIEAATTPDMRSALADAIKRYSSMDDEEREQFR